MIHDPGRPSNGRARRRRRRAPDPKTTKTDKATDGRSRKAPTATPARSPEAFQCDFLAANAGWPGSRGRADSSQFPDIQPTDLPVDIVLARLRALRLRITGNGPSWQATCPAHADTKPSLSLTETDEGVLLVHCWGGCDTETVLAKLGLDLRRLFPSLIATQFSERRAQGAMRFEGGGASGEIAEPTEEERAHFEMLLKRWPAPLSARNQLAAQFGLPREAVDALKIGYVPYQRDWDDHSGCWLLPERDDKGRVVGIVRRFHDSEKRAISGSTRGLTIPVYGPEWRHGPIYLPEGASDTAALFSVGAFAVGRASAEGSAAVRLWLTRLLHRLLRRSSNRRAIIVVGDRGDASGAGERGARKLAQHLREALDRSVAWALPPKAYKDVREQIVSGKWSRGLLIQKG